MPIQYRYPSRRVIRTRPWISDEAREDFYCRSVSRFNNRLGCVTGGVLSEKQINRLDRLLPEPCRKRSLNAQQRRSNRRIERDYRIENDYRYDLSDLDDF